MTIKRMDHVSVVVDDLDDTAARLRVHGAELVGEVGPVRGQVQALLRARPAGIIVALAEELF